MRASAAEGGEGKRKRKREKKFSVLIVIDMWYGLYDESRKTTGISQHFFLAASRLRPLCNSSLLSYHFTVIYTFHSCFSATMNCRRRSRSFPIKQRALEFVFSPAKLFLPAGEVWRNVIVSERGKVRGNMKGATFLFMEVQEFIQWESLSRQPAEKGREKARQHWSWKFGWVMKNEGKLSGKKSVGAFFCVQHQFWLYFMYASPDFLLLLLNHASEIQILCWYVAYECDILWWIYLMEFRHGGAYQKHIHIERNFRKS